MLLFSQNTHKEIVWMVIRKRLLLVATILALTLALPALAQRRNSQQPEPAAGGSGAPVGPMAQSKPELDAFVAIQNEQNPANVVPLADKYLATYPMSQLNGYVQRFRMLALMRTGKCQEAITAGETGLSLEASFLEQLQNADPKVNKIDKNSPEFKSFVTQTDTAKLQYYQTIMSCHQQLNNAEKTIEWGEKALAQNPEDLVSLLTVSTVLAEKAPENDKQKEEQMKRALELGKKAADKVTALVASPVAAQMREEQKSGLVSQAHQTIGLANLHLKKLGDAQKEYLLAIAAKKDDPVSYYRLGLAYAQDRKNDQAMEALAKSIFLKGVSEPEARRTLTLLYEAKNKSTQGMEEYIASAGQKIGQ
jgi:tetratricopeptide (TPR) repeat protein